MIKIFTSAIATVALSVALVGCGSDHKTETKTSTSTSTTTSTSATTTTSTSASATPGAQHKTIADYIKENQIAEAEVHRGDPGSPNIDLAMPDGWKLDETATTSYGGIVLAQPADPTNPPRIQALVSKLTGNVDPAKLLEYAPGELQNLPGFDGSAGVASTLSNFQAWQLNGAFDKDGVKRTIAQKTVVIPGQGAVYVLQLNAGSLATDQGPLMDAVQVIDEKTTITP